MLEQDKLEVQLALEHTPLKVKIDYATIPNDSDFGTADSLRYIYDKYDSFKLFMVLSASIWTLLESSLTSWS